MAEILLCSEKFIKEVSNISNNVAGKYILPSLREAQETKLRNIYGDALLHKVKALIAEDNLTGHYRTLVDMSQYYLTYCTIIDVINKVSYKIANAGVVKTSDENLYNASFSEIVSQKEYYQTKADSALYDLQSWMIDNRTHLPELTQNCLHHMRCHLWTNATSGMMIGGMRGKRIDAHDYSLRNMPTRQEEVL